MFVMTFLIMRVNRIHIIRTSVLRNLSLNYAWKGQKISKLIVSQFRGFRTFASFFVQGSFISRSNDLNLQTGLATRVQRMEVFKFCWSKLHSFTIASELQGGIYLVP